MNPTTRATTAHVVSWSNANSVCSIRATSGLPCVANHAEPTLDTKCSIASGRFNKNNLNPENKSSYMKPPPLSGLRHTRTV